MFALSTFICISMLILHDSIVNEGIRVISVIDPWLYLSKYELSLLRAQLRGHYSLIMTNAVIYFD